MDYLTRLQSIFRMVLDEPTLQIDSRTDIENLEGWDSVVTIQVVLALEQEFTIRFSTDDVATVKSVADLIRLVEKYS